MDHDTGSPPRVGTMRHPVTSSRAARACVALLCATLYVVSPRVAAATPVVGTLTFSGSMTFGSSFMNFTCALACPANSGDVQVGSAGLQSGSFVPLANATGYDRNLAFLGAQPINTPFVLANFLSFASAPDIAIDLGFIDPGTGTATCTGGLGASCTPRFAALVTPSNPLGLSPYVFTSLPTGTSFMVSLAGTARRISTGETSTFTGLLTTQFAGLTSSQLASTLAAGGTLPTTFSAALTVTPTVTTPEPATVALLAPALLALGGLARRRRSRA
jgi:hypothetical protein